MAPVRSLARACFRLEGPDALPDAPARFAREVAAFGAITFPALTDRESRYLRALDPTLTGEDGSES